MPSTKDVAKVFKALNHADVATARQFAEEIVTSEEQKGNLGAARILRGSLSPVPTREKLANESFLITSLALRPNRATLADVVLPASIRRALTEVVAENKYADRLRDHGIEPRRKILLAGPPGCGKSLTAEALATELQLPLYVVRFDAIIGALLGQTALNLRQLFRFTESTKSVLLFDEIDALGKRRGSSTDVGELDRIVIALMQEIELSAVQGVVVATSNIPESLDPALWRRFDISIRFPKPKRTAVVEFAKAKAAAFGIRLSARLLTLITASSSFAEAEKLVLDELRRRILKGLSQ